jgi:hypothetical protein
MNQILAFVTECWLPLAIACSAGLGLYYLGRAEGRRRRPQSLAERSRRHHARSLLFRP